MGNSLFLTEVLVLLVAAVSVVSIFRFFRASPVLGYLFAGLLIGPHSMAYISNIHTVQVLGEFGVVFLLFALGLKMPLQRLQVLRRYVFGLGVLQVFLTALVFGCVAFLMGMKVESCIVIGSALSLSSTAVVMQVLGERGEFALRHGRVSFAILLSQDLSVVMLLILVTRLVSEKSTILQDFALAGVKVFVVMFSIILIGRILLRPIYRLVARFDNPELFVAFTILVILLTSYVTKQFELSMELGAFLAGLLLSETEYRHQVEADIQPFYGLLLGLFFMSVGMTIDLSFMVDHWRSVSIALLGMVVLKCLILFVLCRPFNIPRASAVRVALLLAPGGEFVFVLFTKALTLNLISHEVAQLFYAVVAVSMALTPFLAMLGKFVAEKWLEQESELSIKASLSEIGDLKNHVIVAGWGRVGKLVTKLLAEQMIPFVVIDNDMNRVSEGRTRGLPVFYGDARRVAVMRTLGAAKARAALVSINNTKSAVQATLMLRRQFPNIDVSVRLRDSAFAQKLTEAGATVVMPQNLEPSLRLASIVLESMGRPSQEATQIVERFRKTHFSHIAEKGEEDAINKALAT